LAIKPSGELVREGETIIVESPGAGGYGPPAKRMRAAIELDQLNEKFSEEYIARHYALALPTNAGRK
jgi:N-methylhydantoinase B